MPPEQLKKSNYFPELTGVRALAAMMVYIHHFNPFIESVFGKIVFGMTNQLAIGVTLFFVLSGYLIANRYLELKDFDFKRYFLYRFARIYPMYFLLTTITLITMFYPHFALGSFEKIVYLANISFLRGFSDDFKFSLVAQGWSLTVEETFYLLAPLFFLFIRKRWIYLFIFPVILFFIGSALTNYFSIHPFWGLFKSFKFTNSYTFFGRSFEFFVGIAMAILLKNKPEKLAQKSQHGVATYAGIIMIIASLPLLDYSFSPQTIAKYDYVPFFIINNVILPIVGIAPFYYGLITEETIISKFFRNNLIVLLGKSSYIFYLIHMGIFRQLLPNFDNLFVKTVSDVAILQLLSIILFLFVEEPLNKAIRNIAGKLTTKTTAPKTEHLQ